MPTSFTFNKSAMPDSVCIMADRTRLGSVGGIDINNSNSFSQSLVFNKKLKLVKSPPVNPSIIFSCCPNSFQIFHDDYIANIQTSNNITADIVIAPTHKPRPVSRKIFEFPFGSFCAFTLENRNKSVMLNPKLLNIFSVEFSVRSNSNLIDAKVNAQNSFMLVRTLDIFPSECESKIIFIFVLSQKAFSDFPVKIFQSIIRNLNGNFNSAFNSGDRNNIIFETKRTRSIIPNRNSVNKWFSFCFLNHSTSLFNAGDRKLRGQGFSQFGIDKGMQFNIIFNLHSPSSIDTELKSNFVEFNSLNNRIGNFQFYRDTSNQHQDLRIFNYLNLKDGNSSPEQVQGSPCQEDL